MTARVLAVGTWDDGPGYPRARALLAGLRASGVEVAELRVPLDSGPRTELLRSPRRAVGYLLRSTRARMRLGRAFAQLARQFRPDVVLVPSPGHLAVRWVRRWFDGPVVLDLLLSAHGTAVEDRRLFATDSLGARMMLHLDRSACRAADLVVVDTPQHQLHVGELVAPHTPEVEWVPVSDPDDGGAIPIRPPRAGDGPLRLLSFGTGVPLHGLPTLLRAVADCGDRVALTLIGGRLEDRMLAIELLGGRVDVRPEFLPLDELRAAIDDSELVAGVFGASRKATMVIPFKMVHALARARAVVTQDSAAVRALCEPGVDCLVSRAGDTRDLTRVLLSAAASREELRAVGRRARERYETTFSLAATGARLRAAIEARFDARSDARSDAIEVPEPAGVARA